MLDLLFGKHSGVAIAQSVQWQLRAVWSGLGSSQEQRFLPFANASRPAPVSTQPPIIWVPGTLSLRIKLTTYLHLAPRQENVDLYLHSSMRIH